MPPVPEVEAEKANDLSGDVGTSMTGACSSIVERKQTDANGKSVMLAYDKDRRLQSSLGERAPTLLDSAVACWHEMKEKNPKRAGFTIDELVEYAGLQWSRICWFAKKHEASKKLLKSKIRNGKLQSDTCTLFCLANASGEWRVRWPVILCPIPNRRKRGRPRTKRSTGNGISETEKDADDGKAASRDKGVDSAGDGEKRSGERGDDADFSQIPKAWMEAPSGAVRLSSLDKAEDVVVVDDAEVSGYKGFRSVRATHGITVGDFYFEAEVLDWDGDGAVRLGFSTRCSVIEGPVGFDCYGYGVRDRNGALVHRSQLTDYGPSFGPGDVIGCRIHLNEAVDVATNAKIDAMEVAWLKYRFEAYMQGRPPQSAVDTFPDSFVEFYKNGTSMGRYVPEASSSQKGETVPKCGGLLIGTYYPTISVFKAGKARVNFGPGFKYDIPAGSRAFAECGTSEEPVEAPSAPAPSVPAPSVPASSGPASSGPVHAGPETAPVLPPAAETMVHQEVAVEKSVANNVAAAKKCAVKGPGVEKCGAVMAAVENVTVVENGAVCTPLVETSAQEVFAAVAQQSLTSCRGFDSDRHEGVIGEALPDEHSHVSPEVAVGEEREQKRMRGKGF